MRVVDIRAFSVMFTACSIPDSWSRIYRGILSLLREILSIKNKMFNKNKMLSFVPFLQANERTNNTNFCSVDGSHFACTGIRPSGYWGTRAIRFCVHQNESLIA